MAGNVYGGTFCSPGERQICTIGTGYIANYVSGFGVDRTGATLTDKRIYFSGSVYTKNDKGRFSAFKQRKIVNTRDVTGTGYHFYDPLYLMIWGIMYVFAAAASMFAAGSLSYYDGLFFTLAFVSGIVSVVFFILYFTRRMTLIEVEYAGGNIAFDVKWIQQKEQDNFIRNVHLAKDNLYSNAAIARARAINRPPSAQC